MTTRAIPVVATLACLALLGGGCTSVHNERLVLGPEGAPTTVHLPALWGSTPLAPATGPSTTTASRENWSEVTIVAVNDGVEHQEPLVRQPWPMIDTTRARARGAYPTIQTAVETGGSPGAQAAEGFAWPVAIGADIVMAIPRLFHQAHRSPIGTYDRDPAAPPIPLPVEDEAPMVADR